MNRFFIWSRISTITLSLVSITLFIFFLIEKNINLLFIVIIILLLLVPLILSVIEWVRKTPKKYKSPKEIEKYMKDILKKEGRTVVFTRDMTWAKPEIENIMIDKSLSKELTIIMPAINDLALKLKEKGAEVYEYPKLNFTPKSRFTIVYYGKPESLMAIGMKDENNNHCISEYRNGHDTQFHLAEDLVSIIKNYNDR